MNPEEIKQIVNKIIDDDTLKDDNFSMDAFVHISKALNILLAQLTKDTDIKTKYSNFCGVFLTFETIVKSRKLAPADYEEKIKAYKETDDFKKEGEGIIKAFKLTNYKLQLLLSEIYDTSVLTQPLKA